MLEQFHRRLVALKQEYQSSQAAMAELDAKRSHLRDTMLRLSGAIQVLEEELVRAQSSTDATASSIATTPDPTNALNSEQSSNPNYIPAEIPLPSTYEILDANESL
jgi:septal ring factor EnvC (AmiA/AmiB activator)